MDAENAYKKASIQNFVQLKTGIYVLVMTESSEHGS